MVKKLTLAEAAKRMGIQQSDLSTMIADGRFTVPVETEEKVPGRIQRRYVLESDLIEFLATYVQTDMVRRTGTRAGVSVRKTRAFGKSKVKDAGLVTEAVRVKYRNPLS